MSDLTLGQPSQVRSTATHLTPTDWGLLFVRLALGIVFVVHGWGKVTNLHQTVAGMSATGIPVPLIYLDVLAEFGGGLAILFGLLSRIASLGLIVVMLVAIFKVHLQFGFLMNWFGNQKGEGIEYHILVIAMSLLLALTGPGRLAIGDFEKRWFGAKGS